jgi:hypothetical protein
MYEFFLLLIFGPFYYVSLFAGIISVIDITPHHIKGHKDKRWIKHYSRGAEVEKVVQPVNLVDRKYLLNHNLTQNIWGKSFYILSILAYHRNLSAKA